MTKQEFSKKLDVLSSKYRFYGPKRFKNAGRFSDTDMVRYDFVDSVAELDFSVKSNYSSKEFTTPLNQTLFFFNKDEYQKPEIDQKPVLIFLRACDYHAVKRMDEIYLRNKYKDVYYSELRELVKYAVIGCHTEYDNCFCVSMGTNTTDTYDIAINYKDEDYNFDVKDSEINKLLDSSQDEFKLDFISENKTIVNIPRDINLQDIINLDMWDEYDKRCIACGACNFVCPTCSCFTTQDITLDDSNTLGERKRVGASCMVAGFSQMAGGHDYRVNNGAKIRFKAMHKMVDFEKRFGYSMCVGCGRCSDVCPELINFAATVNKLYDVTREEN